MEIWDKKWRMARESWLSLLDQVDKTRDNLGCFYKNAWYRGTTDASHQLLPSLLRPPKVVAGKLFQLTTQIRQLEKQHREAHGTKKEAYARFHASGNQKTKDGKELQDLLMAKASLKRLRQEQMKLKDQQQRILLQVREQCQNPDSLREFESDAFTSFSRRSGVHDKRSSWDILGEMAHYGGQTRLLDWTQSLSVALFFALRRYRTRLEEQWNETRSKQREWVEIDEGSPCIWILNPFLLSLWATNAKRSSIWDFSNDELHDYYRSFCLESAEGSVPTWPYSFPIPIYPPWRDLRIAAQRGVFTVHGRDVSPIEDQRPSAKLAERLMAHKIPPKPIVEKIEIGKDAAIYGVRHLRRYEGLDYYLLFRDTDSLGRAIQDEIEEAKGNCVNKLEKQFSATACSRKYD